jgi:hypothetical protein
MATVLGWFIFWALLYLASMTLLAPALIALRRRYPGSRKPVRTYWMGSGILSVGLWYLIPLLVWWTIGRKAP